MNKFSWKTLLVGVIFGVLVSIPIVLCILCPYVEMDTTIGLIDSLNLIATVLIAIVIPFSVQKWVDNKKIIRDIIVKDIVSLIDLYFGNTDILESFRDGTIDLETARSKVRKTFHKGDTIIDGLNEQLISAHLKEKVDLKSITEPYFKYLTNGNLFGSQDFVCDNDFISKHEIELRKTTTQLKLSIHKVVR